MNGYEKGLGYYRSDRVLIPVLPVESKACLGMGWRMGVEVVIDCAQPDGWKITSVDPNVKQVSEWRWFLRESHKVTMTSAVGS